MLTTTVTVPHDSPMRVGETIRIKDPQTGRTWRSYHITGKIGSTNNRDSYAADVTFGDVMERWMAQAA